MSTVNVVAALGGTSLLLARVLPVPELTSLPPSTFVITSILLEVRSFVNTNCQQKHATTNRSAGMHRRPWVRTPLASQPLRLSNNRSYTKTRNRVLLVAEPTLKRIRIIPKHNIFVFFPGRFGKEVFGSYKLHRRATLVTS